MAAVADSAEKSESSQIAKPTGEMNAGALEGQPWMAYAARRAQVTAKTVGDATDSAIRTAGNHISKIRSTSSDGLQQTIEGWERVKNDFVAYEDMAFGKLKEGILVAALHPSLSCGIAAGVGILAFKRPRRFLWRNTLRFFVSEEASNSTAVDDICQRWRKVGYLNPHIAVPQAKTTLLSSAEAKVKVLRQSIDLMKSESKKLGERAQMAEEDFKWGQKYLRETGDQMQNVIHSIDAVHKKAEGLKDILGELSGRESYRLRSQVSSIPYQVKQERKSIERAVMRMTDYGITIR